MIGKPSSPVRREAARKRDQPTLAPRRAADPSSWMNGYGKLRRVTDKQKIIVGFYLYLAAALTVIRRLINRARSLYRWPGRPTTRRLR